MCGTGGPATHTWYVVGGRAGGVNRCRVAICVADWPTRSRKTASDCPYGAVSLGACNHSLKQDKADTMAGHSKFKNIMHRKGAQDKKRSAQFSKLSREITVAAKMGMPDRT
jgi:hypothetical protein